MRKQYHSRHSENGRLIWDIDNLIELSDGFEVVAIPLDEIGEIDECYWFDSDNQPTCREIAGHAKLIEQADLSFPIILCSNKRVMDGMHRVLKALNLGLETIDAVVFAEDPAPDYVDVPLDELPYDRDA